MRWKITSHSLRSGAATTYINHGGSREGLKRLGCWKSDSVAEGYIRTTTETSRQAAILLTSEGFLKSKPLRVKIRPAQSCSRGAMASPFLLPCLWQKLSPKPEKQSPDLLFPPSSSSSLFSSLFVSPLMVMEMWYFGFFFHSKK